jgi:pentatricopeptide repeat protein
LGIIYAEAGRPAEAVPLLEEAYRQLLPPLTWDNVGTTLVEAYAKAGKSGEAIRLIDEMLSDASRLSKLGGRQHLNVLVAASKALLDLKQFAKAEPICGENLAQHEKLASTYQVLPWRVARAKSFLGSALLGQKKYAEAERFLLAGYERLRKDEKEIPLGRPEVLPDAIQRLVDLYEATGQKDKAEHYRKELEAVKAADSKPAMP